MRTALLGGAALLAAAVAATPVRAQPEIGPAGSIGFLAGEPEVATDGEGASLYLGSRTWGRLEFSGRDGVADGMQAYVPRLGTGLTEGDWDDLIPGGNRFVTVRDGGDGTRLNYYTPLFGGFRFGAAYAPDAGDRCTSGPPACPDSEAPAARPDGADEVIELGLAYTNEFGGIGVTASGVYTVGEAGAAADDISDWAVGAEVAFGNFTVGGNYVRRDTEPEPAWGASLGVTYTLGQWGVGANYVYNEDDRDRELRSYGVGATYTIAPGLTAGADVVGFDGQSESWAGDGFVVVTEIKAQF